MGLVNDEGINVAVWLLNIVSGKQPFRQHCDCCAQQLMEQKDAWERRRSQWCSGAEQEHLLPKAQVKPDQAWSPHRRVTVTC